MKSERQMVKVPECLLKDLPEGAPFTSTPFVEMLLTEQEVFAYLDKAEKMIESSVGGVDAPPALVLLDGFHVCPQSLITYEVTELLRQQAQCEKYHSSPYHSIWMRNPNNVLEAFEAIEVGIASNFRHDLRENEMKSNSGQQGGKRHKIGPGNWGQIKR